jgi:hypothetical protein
MYWSEHSRICQRQNGFPNRDRPGDFGSKGKCDFYVAACGGILPKVAFECATCYGPIDLEREFASQKREFDDIRLEPERLAKLIPDVKNPALTAEKLHGKLQFPMQEARSLHGIISDLREKHGADHLVIITAWKKRSRECDLVGFRRNARQTDPLHNLGARFEVVGSQVFAEW